MNMADRVARRYLEAARVPLGSQGGSINLKQIDAFLIKHGRDRGYVRGSVRWNMRSGISGDALSPSRSWVADSTTSEWGISGIVGYMIKGGRLGKPFEAQPFIEISRS